LGLEGIRKEGESESEKITITITLNYNYGYHTLKQPFPMPEHMTNLKLLKNNFGINKTKAIQQ
jgi:hypothetical protein